MKASQEDSEEEILKDSSNEDEDITMLTKNFKKLLKRTNSSRTRDYKKGDGKKNKEVTCYECKKPRHIRNDCLRLKFKNKGAKDKKKIFKAS